MNITVYGAASNNIDKSYIDAGEELGRLMVKRGHSLVFGGGDDGLIFYRRIVPLYTPKLKWGGQLIFELDGSQAEYTRELMKAENYGDIEIFDDLGGIHRAIKGTLFEF